MRVNARLKERERECRKERVEMRNVKRQIRQTLHFARAYPEEHPRDLGVRELPEA